MAADTPRNEPKIYRILRTVNNVLAAALFLFIAFIGGVSLQDFRAVHDGDSFGLAVRLIPERVKTAFITAAEGQTEQYTPYELYSDVLATVKSNYYGPDIDTTQMTYNAIRGMMGALHDRYTRFMDPKAYSAMNDENNGEFVGIGALLGTNKQNEVYVIHPLPGGPALRYKVLPGDIIAKVNGNDTLKMKDVDVVNLIRGEPNTKVTLTLLRHGVPKPVVITIPRQLVQQQVVQYAMIDPVNKIGYISLSVFNEESDDQVSKALTELEGQGMRGLVFDLRENPGGLLNIARDIASRFIPSGPVVWIKDRTGPMKSIDMEPDKHNYHEPLALVVLVNGDSASASEIVSGAIKDTGSGILVGEKTFGKGLVQTIMELPDGSAVAITTQHYFTAKLHDINHKGIMPNIPVSYTDDDQRKMYAFMRAHPDAFYDLPYDRQLQVALSQVRQRMRVASARVN